MPVGITLRAENLQFDLVEALGRFEFDALGEGLSSFLAPRLDALDVVVVVELRRVLEVRVDADLAFGIGGFRIRGKAVVIEQRSGLDVDRRGVARRLSWRRNVEPGAHSSREGRVHP